MKRILLTAALTAGTFAASAAWADPYVDYTPVKGAWEVQTIKVDPNHIDDYLVGLKRGWVPLMETLKRHGVIDQYMIMQKLNSGAGANVTLIQHFTSLGMMDPDKERDMAIQKETEAQLSKEASSKMTSGFDKYRTFESDDIWTEVNMSK